MTSTTVWRISSTLLLGVGMSFPGAAVAFPDEVDASASDFAACQLLGREELAARRGGFEFAGLKFEFGANIRSYIDNRMVLESMINFTSDGAVREQFTELPSFGLSAEETAGPSTGLAVNPEPVYSNAVAAQTPATIDLSGLKNAVGVTVNDIKGYTAALHQVTRERITGLMINTASGRDLRQELEVRVDIANFRQFQQSARQNLLNSRLGVNGLK